jgi:hypothetical protein
MTELQNDVLIDDSKSDSKPDDFKLEWQSTNYKDTITVSKSYFEHLLSCLANQKFIGESPPNADALELDRSEYENIQIENQNVIDKAWRNGMFMLCLEHKMEEAYKEIHKKYCAFWNSHIDFINNLMAEDKKLFPEDDNITFKWVHLVQQEIEMWISLCSSSSSNSNLIIDCKNEIYKHGHVEIDDFDFICKRRGFTPSMINFLVDVLKEIGIGEKLNYSS